MTRRWLGLLLAMALPTLLAWFYMVSLARRPPVDDSVSPASGLNALAVTVYFAGKLFQLALPVIFVRIFREPGVRIAGPDSRGLAAGLIFGLVVAAAIGLVYRVLLTHGHLLDAAIPSVRRRIAEFGLERPVTYFAFALFICVVHSLFEEYYWRWFTFGQLTKLVTLEWAIILSSVAFMSHHVIVLAGFFPGKFWLLAVPLSICVGLGGAAWAWLYHRTKSLYSPWISHLLVDSAIMIVGYDMAFR